MYELKLNAPNGEAKKTIVVDRIAPCNTFVYAYTTISEKMTKFHYIQLTTDLEISADFHSDNVILTIPNELIASLSHIKQ